MSDSAFFGFAGSCFRDSEECDCSPDMADDLELEIGEEWETWGLFTGEATFLLSGGGDTGRLADSSLAVSNELSRSLDAELGFARADFSCFVGLSEVADDSECWTESVLDRFRGTCWFAETSVFCNALLEDPESGMILTGAWSLSCPNMQ